MNDILTIVSLAGFLLWLSRNAFAKSSQDATKVNLLRRILTDFPFVRDVAKQTGTPLDVCLAIIAVESGGNQYATGSVGEIGLMQITFPAVEDVNRVFNQNFNIFDLNIPLVNVKIGCYYLKYLREHTSSWKNAIQAYNAGLNGYKSGVSLGYYNKVKSYLDQYKYL